MNSRGYNLSLPGGGRRVRAESHYVNRSDEVADLKRRLAEQEALVEELIPHLQAYRGRLERSTWKPRYGSPDYQDYAGDEYRLMQHVDTHLAADAAKAALLRGKQQELLIKMLQATVKAYEHAYNAYFSTGAVGDLQDRLDAIDAEYVAAVGAPTEAEKGVGDA